MSVISYASTTDFALILPTADTTFLTNCINQVSRKIDEVCQRVFYPTLTTKQFELITSGDNLSFRNKIFIGDFNIDSNTVVKIDDTLLITSAYDFYPFNGYVYEFIILHKNNIDYSAINNDGWDLKRLVLTGTFGYLTVPDTIKMNTLILTRLVYQSILNKVVKSKRVGELSFTLNEIENFPSDKLIRDMCKPYVRDRVC